MNKNKIFGNKAEAIATDFLIKKNYTILERNWRFSHLEIDIIAKKDDIISIVEVKARKNNFSSFDEIINIKKQKNLISAAEHYLEIKNFDNEIRFDVIFIFTQNNKIEIKHIENAFYSMP
jgi:putative endonuclease